MPSRGTVSATLQRRTAHQLIAVQGEQRNALRALQVPTKKLNKVGGVTGEAMASKEDVAQQQHHHHHRAAHWRTSCVMLALSPAHASRATLEALDRGTSGGAWTPGTGSAGLSACPLVTMCAAKDVRGQSSLGRGCGTAWVWFCREKRSALRGLLFCLAAHTGNGCASVLKTYDP